MAISYRSTRDHHATPFSASQAVLQGLSPDGGLFVPDHLPQLNLELMALPKLTYQELALKILQPFFSDYTATELQECIAKAYGDNFTSPQITPVKFTDELAYLELFHGPTIAFKDLALQLLPHLLQLAAQKKQTALKTVILTATSGDTGKAAMAGFADVKDTQIIVFYPKDGVSEVQEKQMRSQTGANTHVVAITGNFDDAQTKVKEIFDDPNMILALRQQGYQFSSANSINIGRLFPQMVYYFYAYGQILKAGKITAGQAVNFSVPTGNFGDILAGWYAKKLGLPIKKLLCASNENNVLTDFFASGIYDRKRPFHVTTSPSMDILVSSNLERLLFYTLDQDAAKTAYLMNQLSTRGVYTLDAELIAKLQAEFFADFATIDQTATEIKRVFEKEAYPLDPHTAVGSFVARQYQLKTGDLTPMIVVSTASPYKFPEAVLDALDKRQEATGLAALEQLQQVIAQPYPQTIAELFTAPLLHDLTCDPKDMKKLVLKLVEQN